MSRDKVLGGLTPQEVSESRAKHGENVLTPPQKVSIIRLYLEKFQDPIIQVLLVAAVVSLLLAFVENNFIETIGIFIAIFLATAIGFYFELDAAKKFEVLNTLEEEQLVKVRRNGVVEEVMRKDIVVGDVILIETGDEIPADACLVEAIDLQVNESSLTGEPITTKHVEITPSKGTEAYPPNVLLRSSMVMSGRGTAVVTAVGDETEIGKVSYKSTELTFTKTPLSIQLSKLAKVISKIGVTVAVLAFVVFLVHDILVNPIWQTNHYLDMLEVVLHYFMFSVTIIVMAVPEGLPMAVTLSLALNMRRMLKSNNLVRKLHASETMGAVTVICTDKTGTLTQNKMQVNDFARSCEDDELLFEAISANTTAELSLSPNDEANATTTIPEGIGNPTEVALLLWCYKNGKNYNSYRSETKILHQLPFSTERKYMGTISLYNGVPYLFIKGAPEVVLSFCNIAEDKKAETESTLRGYQDKAMRTLALAYKQLDSDVVESIKDNSLSAELLQDLCLQAVFAISDPIREDVPNAVLECQRAGINVKMVTGDTSATAIEIAKQIGIWSEEGVSESEKERWHITGTPFSSQIPICLAISMAVAEVSPVTILTLIPAL